MNNFTYVCIWPTILFIVGIVCFAMYIAVKKDSDNRGKKQLLIGATALVVISLVMAAIIFNYFSQCPNPDCNEWTQSDYCHKCGWEVHATIDCPACENKFDVDNAPVFCPDCGSAVPSN